MERFIQYLDILEDAVYVIALMAERIRRIVILLCFIVVTMVAGGLGIFITLVDSAAGVAVAALLAVMGLYRSATGRPSFVGSAVHG